MRWMVVALLLANLLVFGWYQYAVGIPGEESQLVGAEPAGDSLQLLDGSVESAAAPNPVPVTPSSAPDGEARANVAESMCGMIGAFKEQISAKQVRDRLLALGAAVEIVDIPVTVRTDYWVHMGPYPTRDLAMSALRELQQKGVDSFLIADGELANGVSLGLFRQKASAEALLAERKAQGYEVALREIPRVASELWVVINEGSELAESVRDQLLAVSPGTEYRKNPCGSIVSANKFE